MQMQSSSAYLMPGIIKQAPPELKTLFEEYCKVAISTFGHVRDIRKNGSSKKVLFLSESLIKSKSRNNGLVYIRSMFAYYIKTRYNSHQYSLKDIGRLLSNRDHTTVIHNIRLFQAYLDTKYKPTALENSKGARVDYAIIIEKLQS